MFNRVVTGAFDARRGLRSLAGFGAAGVGLSALALTTGLGIPCPWRSLTGTLCPLCGGTHLGMAVLRGDLATAWAANPFVFLVLGVLTVLAGLWSVEALGGPRVRLPQRLRLPASAWWILLAVVGLIFALFRNLE